MCHVSEADARGLSGLERERPTIYLERGALDVEERVVEYSSAVCAGWRIEKRVDE